MNSQTLKSLIASGEIDRVEMTRSVTDTDKFREAICSFSNDMAGKGEPGYLLIGVDEKDASFRLPVTDKLLQQFAAYRSDGQILPLPVLSVSTVPHPDGGARTTCRRCATRAGSTSAWVPGKTPPVSRRSGC